MLPTVGRSNIDAKTSATGIIQDGNYKIAYWTAIGTTWVAMKAVGYRAMCAGTIAMNSIGNE